MASSQDTVRAPKRAHPTARALRLSPPPQASNVAPKLKLNAEAQVKAENQKSVQETRQAGERKEEGRACIDQCPASPSPFKAPPIPDSPSLVPPRREACKTTGRDPNADANAREYLHHHQFETKHQYEPTRQPKLEHDPALELERGVFPVPSPKKQTRKTT
ncbi:hypothetical protein EYR38_002416 [Pleurotus pulmonarius]|nr:hypothetical protein EYR38_002416 [Pleurotus pulmonarius]